MRTIILGLLAFTFVFVILANPTNSPALNAQESSPKAPLITAENIHNLKPIAQFDFDRLPEGFTSASGLFAMSPDGEYMVTFANRDGEAPFSQVVLWGYSDDNTPILNAIEGNHLNRILSADGRCLAAGYLGYYAVWELDPTQANARLLGKYELPNSGDSVVYLWWAEDTECNLDLYAEVSAYDGSVYVLRPSVSPDPLYTDLFTLEGHEVAGRVGRILPPIAITMDFENRLYRWDLSKNEITATIAVDDYAIFGAINATGQYFVWQRTDYSGLHLIDFQAQTDREVVSYTDVYFSYLTLTTLADIAIGIDPMDARGTLRVFFTADGSVIELGNYRSCQRTQPDLAQISPDGSTLVIGCDMGVEVWRILDETPR